MDARLSPEQTELSDAAERMVADLGVRSVGDLDDGARRRRLEAALAQAGWRTLRAGSAEAPLASGVEAALVVRSFARASADVALLGPLLAHDLMRRAGGGDETDRAVAMDASLESLASPGDGGVVVDAAGCATAVALDGMLVTEVEVPASAGALDAAGSAGGVDLTRRVASAESPAVRGSFGAVSPEQLLGWEALGVALTAADLLGAMEGVFWLTVDYARQRRQFGVEIGSFQAVQHLLAEAGSLIEGACSAVLHAAWAADALAPGEARQAAAVAKAYASEAARTVCETAIQVHGGIGNTWECLAHVYLRRCLVSTEWFGGEGPNLALLAQRRWAAA